MFSARLPLPVLIEHCRAIRHMLDAGITLPKAMRQQANKGLLPVRPVADRVAQELEAGHDLTTALEEEEKHFPPFFIDFVGVAEHTGKLPEILEELEEYYLMLQKLKKDFYSQIAWPVTQLVLAILILSGLIFLRGILPMMPDVTGLGLKGTSGALRFLGSFAGMFVLIWAVYWFFAVFAKKKAVLDRLLMRIPAIGGCLQALALSRFCLGFYLTSEAGMAMRKGMRLSLKATGNGAFEEAAGPIESDIVRGKDLAGAMAKSGLFPDDFILIVETAEVSGQVPEVLHKQAKAYNDLATRRMRMLTSILAKLIYAAIAIFIAYIVISFYAGYFNMLGNI